MEFMTKSILSNVYSYQSYLFWYKSKNNKDIPGIVTCKKVKGKRKEWQLISSHTSWESQIANRLKCIKAFTCHLFVLHWSLVRFWITHIKKLQRSDTSAWIAIYGPISKGLVFDSLSKSSCSLFSEKNYWEPTTDNYAVIHLNRFCRFFQKICINIRFKATML